MCIYFYSNTGAWYDFTSIQGSRFFVGRKGATLGRRQTNTIAFSHESNGTVMGIDASISGEHARIVYDEDGDYAELSRRDNLEERAP